MDGVQGRRRPQRRRGWIWALSAWSWAVVWLAATAASAQPSRLAVPAPLEPWVPWVLHDHPELSCAQLRPDQHVCGWPGELRVEVADGEGRFRLSVWMDRPGVALLPGDEERWPQDVTLDGAAALVGKNGAAQPIVELSTGAHTLEGRFRWTQIPEVLTVPAEVGRVELVVRGEQAPHPRLDAEGRLWLQVSGEGSGPAETDSLRVTVHRRFWDGVPMRVDNRFELNVGGRAREVVLGKALLAGARPVALRGDLPAQVQSDGVVKIYVKPGSHIVEIDAVLSSPVEQLAVPQPGGDFFDEQEVWVWQPDEGLRSVEISGLVAVDPERTTLPADWRSGTTFLAEPGQSLALKETRRGETEAAPNALRLSRKLWLDLDGEGYTVRDQLSGQMAQGWRLNYGPDGTIGRVSQGSDDLLITADPVSSLRGVELRDANVNLQSELRMEESRADLSIVGWDHDVQGLSAEVALPPGWDLLGAEGVDQLNGTWFESWTLFDFFFVLMVALALGKLCGWKWTPLALVALALTHGHDAAPEWVWLHLLATLALLRVLPDGWWRRGVLVYRAAALIFLVIVLVPYGRDQIRFAVHPQVAAPGSWVEGNLDDGSIFSQSMNSPAPAATAPAAEEPMFFEAEQKALEQPMDLLTADEDGRWDGKERSKREMKEMTGLDSLYGGRASGKKGGQTYGYLQLQQVDPNAVVQTGPGLPEWRWRSWYLSWSGPVHKDHTIRLWLISPGWNRVLTVLRVALTIALALLLLARADMRWQKPGAPPRDEKKDANTPAAPAAAAALVLVALLGWSVSAQAQPTQQFAEPGRIGPSTELLQELEQRLLEQRGCDGACVVVSQAAFRVKGLKVTITADVHARRDSAWFLPGPTDPLHIDEVRVDGAPSRQLRREPGGLTAVRLAAGRHTVEVSGTLVNRDVVTLQLDAGTRPQFVTFESDEWSVDGIKNTGAPDNSLQLTRRAAGGAGAEGVELSADLPPWFTVTRRFALGLPWQVITDVRRLNAERPQIVKIPLVEGEKLITEGTRVEEGKVLVDFPRGVDQVSYTSELTVTPKLTIRAAQDQPWTEDWIVECSRIWRCAFEGLAPIRTVEGATYRPTWKPWPGESLTILVGRPEGAPGQAATVDNVSYEVTPGKRLLQACLTMRVRASQGTWQKVQLPPGAELQSVQVDGRALTIRPQDGALNLPIAPGAQNIRLEWQQPWERSIFETMPPVHIGSNAVNVNLSVILGEDRWLLWAAGPSWGPAVLFWSHIVLLLIAAVLLGRVRTSPLKTWEWLLLAIGFAQLPTSIVLFPVVWFFVLGWRERAPIANWWRFDLLQVGIVILTLVAVGVTYGAIHTNLLFDVDMQVQGASSTNQVLRWYVDQTDGALPSATIASLPLLAWRILMLLWALWLVARLLKWAPWAWRAFASTGFWRPIPPTPPAMRPMPPASSAPPPASATPAQAPPTAPAAEPPPAAPDAAAAAPEPEPAPAPAPAPVEPPPAAAEDAPEPTDAEPTSSDDEAPPSPR